MSIHTVTSEDAHAAATRDRADSADRVLCTAVAAAAQLVREGCPGKAEYVMARAAASADRILGGICVEVGTVWTSRHGHPIHTCVDACAADDETCCWGGARRPHTPVEGVCIWCGVTP